MDGIGMYRIYFNTPGGSTKKTYQCEYIGLIHVSTNIIESFSFRYTPGILTSSH